jgi:tetratricopeptide (TPR) repeat protein
MPSHIYYRVGRYLDALEDNKTAVKVDEKYLADTNAPMGVYRLGYYPHNVHFVMASAQMAGDGPTVIAAAEKLRELIPDEVARGIAMVQPVKAAPYFAHAQFSTPETILALPDPGDAIPLCQGDVALRARRRAGGAVISRRGSGGRCHRDARAHRGFQVAEGFRRPGAGGASHRAHTDPGARGPGQRRQPHRHRAVRAGGGVAGRAALHRAALLVLSDPAVACRRPAAGRPLRRGGAQFQRALSRAPANGWSYYGLAELHKSRGDTAAARKAEADLARIWIGDRRLLQISNL